MRSEFNLVGAFGDKMPVLAGSALRFVRVNAAATGLESVVDVFLPLSGGTLTGALTGTAATFTGNTAFGDAEADTVSISGVVVKNGTGRWIIPAASAGVTFTISGGGLSVTGAVVLTGAVSGITTLAMGGALTGATTGAFSGAVSTGALTATGFAYTPTSSQAFTATPTFNAALSNVFEFSGVMTANVTTCTITNPLALGGQTIMIRVEQDATGSRTFAAPAGAKIVGSIGPTANTASLLTLTYSLKSARWEGAWTALPS